MSARFSVAELVAWCGGRLLRGADRGDCVGLSIDSRAVPAASLFIAIRGERFDAHAFLGDAIHAGANALLVERGAPYDLPAESDVAVVEVADTTLALGAIGTGIRKRFTGPVIAITGSNGKTSTKELCAAAVAEALPCLKTQGNLNNHIGVPLTLARLEAEHRAAVIEVGTNHPGEIATLAAIARPTIAIFTNVGTAHAEYLGDRAGIAKEKGSLFAALPETGTAVANADDPHVMSQCPRSPAPILTFGRAADADIRAEALRDLGLSGFSFRLCTPAGSVDTRIRSLSPVHVENALAAAGAAIAAGVPPDAIARGLAKSAPASGRLQALRFSNGVTVLNDAYNANPQSMRAALETLCRLGREGRKIAALGEMGELGEGAADAHREIGAAAATCGVDHLYAVGGQAQTMAEAAREAGLGADAVHACENAEAAGELLARRVAAGDFILLKGSRSVAMERVLRAFEQVFGPGVPL